MGVLASIHRNTNTNVMIDFKDRLTQKEKRILIAEWPRLMKRNPDLFRTVWLKAVERSTAIKRIFGIADGEKPEHNKSFMRLITAVHAFFNDVILTHRLDDNTVSTVCTQLGARHLTFRQRGFQAMFWDIFMVCMNDVITETLSAYMSGSQRVMTIYAYHRLVHLIVEHMRNGYMFRRRSATSDISDAYILDNKTPSENELSVYSSFSQT
uniref:Globin family profile domain-containing protein n=1 Tax=Plectus sambesii TaxID=2011161 RepID=A0A914V7C1_9BILA